VQLTKRYWVEAERYPYFTMVGQSIGSMVLGWEAISLVVPHVMLGMKEEREGIEERGNKRIKYNG
jgi:ALG11 mannosyltransferase N-terminus